MVWFQCEDCGDNLKKPKLPGHFRCCRASRFSCIDCGAEFDQRSVQQHTQCVSEAEKYGPKGQNSNPKTKKAPAAAPEELVNMGLTTQKPWRCTLCNVGVTGRDVLLVHGNGKGHVAKAKAALAANGHTVAEEEQQKQADDRTGMQETESGGKGVDVQNGEQTKKRKRTVDDKDSSKKRKRESDGGVKWRKLIRRELKTSADGRMKKSKLRKAVMRAAMEAVKAAGLIVDAQALTAELASFLASTTKFQVEGKYIRLRKLN